jgi:DNA (cytosine-5)-methyltransferase 1
MKHGSLFAGIGGFEKGAKLADIETVYQCEIEPFQTAILAKHYSETLHHADIRTFEPSGFIDIISGGFPCQDISINGKGQGINGLQSSLWSEMFRICRRVRPNYIIIENSPMLTIRGFEQVLCDLSTIGYNAEWQSISNNDFGFSHLRKRIYVIAYSDQIRQQIEIQNRGCFKSIFREFAPNQIDGYTLSQRIQSMPKSELSGKHDGFRDWVHRVESLGNAVNPVVAYYLFECIKSHINHDKFNLLDSHK